MAGDEWDSGFRSGQSDIQADFAIALEDLVPDDVDPRNPQQVAEYIRKLKEETTLMAKSYSDLAQQAVDQVDQLIARTGPESEG